MLTFEIIAVFIGGAAGSVCRFLLQRVVQGLPWEGGFPYGVWVVNCLGSWLMGFLFAVPFGRWSLDPVWRAGVFIGILGGFTTFSSFSLDTIQLLESGRWLYAVINIGLSVGGCLLATALGLWMGRLF